MITVQFHIEKWDDPEVFARDFKVIEAVYGRYPSAIDIDRAYARYWKKAVDPDSIITDCGRPAGSPYEGQD